MIQKPYRTTSYRVLGVGGGGAILVGAGCGSSEERDFDESDAGQILGGVAGAAAGSQIGEGSGQTVATVAGALIGAVVGERIGARMEEDDEHYTAMALEENETGETAAWENPDTGNEFQVTPTGTFEDSGRPCREFEFRVETEDGEDEQEHTACRNSDGTWEIVDS